MLKPIFKYTGGKYDEYKYFKHYLPNAINNYYEPFAGGAGVMFQLHNDKLVKGINYINDVSVDLVNLYRNITNSHFVDSLYNLCDVWENVVDFSEEVSEKYSSDFSDMLKNKGDNIFSKNVVFDDILNIYRKYNIVLKYDTHGHSFEETFKKGLADKAAKFLKKVEKYGDDNGLTERQLASEQISTSICQSFYFVIRDMYNEWMKNGGNGYTTDEMCCHWLYIREFCYGSMFRFSKDGTFNVPYGGYGYNKKCFRCKADCISKIEMQNFFSDKVKVFNLDFCDFLNRDFDNNDFVFLDPPYIGRFSEYDNNSFTTDDHVRLYECLFKIKNLCKWMMVIRVDPIITDLYKDECYTKMFFDKTYAYQPRKNATYDTKKCKHVIITNYKTNSLW